jgi:hypothetical protein
MRRISLIVEAAGTAQVYNRFKKTNQRGMDAAGMKTSANGSNLRLCCDLHG